MDPSIWLEMLSWNKTEGEQQQAIRNLISIENSHLVKLVQPNNKDCWDNAARVLTKIKYPRIKYIIPELLAWLKDINWPGALEIRELLCTVPKSELLGHLVDSILEAKKTDDDMWLYWLKDLVDKMGINREDFGNVDAYDIIKEIGL